MVKLCLTSLAKFLAINLLDGSIVLYETLTGIIWKTERLPGKHTGVAIIESNFVYEVAKEGYEHRLINLLEREKGRLYGEFAEARGLNDTEESSKKKSQSSKEQSNNNHE